MMEPPPARMIAGHGEVRLADASLMTIRPVASGDTSLIAAAFAELSEGRPPASSPRREPSCSGCRPTIDSDVDWKFPRPGFARASTDTARDRPLLLCSRHRSGPRDEEPQNAIGSIHVFPDGEGLPNEQLGAAVIGSQPPAGKFKTDTG